MSNFMCPLKGEKVRLTSPFGYRLDPFGSGKKLRHQGVDLATTPNTNVEVMASAKGTVQRAEVIGSYGYTVIIRHAINGKIMDSLYAHLKANSIKVKKGQVVEQGQTIGIMGNTGSSTAPHLHFEIHNGIWKSGQPNAINPMSWIRLEDNVPNRVENPKIDYTKKLGYNAPKNSKAYRIHTDSYKSKSDAEKAKLELVKQGFIKYAEIFGNDKNGYRLQTGKYNSQKEAEQVALKLLEAKKIGYASIIGSQK